MRFYINLSSTFKSLAFSYFSLSLCPFKVLLAARKTYLNSFGLIGSFQNANHVTVLSCLISFQLQYIFQLRSLEVPHTKYIYPLVCKKVSFYTLLEINVLKKIRKRTFHQGWGILGLEHLFLYLL